MPRSCCVIGCKTRPVKDKVKFYRFPLVEERKPLLKRLSKKRQELWLRAINRKDIKMETLKYRLVCFKHFISGVKAKLDDSLNPDWVPSVNLGYNNTQKQNATQRLTRYLRLQKRKEKIAELQPNQPCTFNEILIEDIPEESCKAKEISCQTDDFYYRDMVNEALLKKCQELTKENDMLKKQNKVNDAKRKQIEIHNFSLEDLKNNKRVRYLTGFNSFVVFEIIYQDVKSSIPIVKSGKLKKLDVFLMTLMKIRLDLPFTFLALIYKISVKTVSNLFHKTIISLHEELKHFVFWPDKKAAAMNMPEVFKIMFKDKAPIIIDCFEVFCEKSGNYLARVNTFSNYKHHNTLKYLVAISSFGSIIYISKAYGGRCSDKFIVENCGFLDLIQEGNIILADRGFLIEPSINERRAKLIIPAFKNKKNQMEALVVERNRNIASIRIHVERIIGVLRQKFLIFSNRQPITAISKKNGRNMYCDYIMKIACAIINLNPPVISNY